MVVYSWAWMLLFAGCGLRGDLDTANQIKTETEPETKPQKGAFTGTWGKLMVQASKATSQVPIIGEMTVDSKTEMYALVKIEQIGKQLDITKQICDIRIDSGTIFVNSTIPQAFIDSLPIEQLTGTMTPNNEMLIFMRNKAYTTRGVRLTDIANEILPTEPSDHRVFDQDKDGHPGMTVEVGGIVSGKLFIIQRFWNVLRGEHITPNTIDGLVQWNHEQVVLDADNDSLKRGAKAVPNPDPLQSYFRMTRVQDDTTCVDLNTAGDYLFVREDQELTTSD